jgi:methyl-accepting chemotaxis protein
MNLSNFRIATKIGGGFGIIVAILIFMGLTALSQLKAVNASTEQIATNNLASIQTAATMRDLISDIRFAEARHVMSANESEMGIQEARMAVDLKKLSDMEATQAKVFDSPIEVETLHAFKQHRDQWSAVWEKLRPISRKGAAGSDEAQKMYQTESAAAFNLAIADALKLGEVNSTQSQLAWSSAQETYSSARAMLISTIAIAIGLAAFFGWYISRAIAAPIGDAVRAAREIAAGDMTASIHPEGTDEISQLLRALDEMRKSLATVVASVRQGSDGVATASAEIAQGNQDLSARTENQASALEQTAASMEQLGAQVKQNADSAKQASQLASSASSVAVRGGDVVGRVVETMKEINVSSKKISEIIGVIDGIAFQTNILALNAAVEAARAGDQGRGFAVVASEVRALAGRSADAAKQIKVLINESVERVEQGTVLVDEARTTMSEVVGSISKVSDLVGEISSASHEQSAGVEQVGEAVSQIDQVTQQNAALVEQMAAAASSLKSQAGDLVQTVAVFKLDPKANIVRATVRAAIVKAPPYKGSERRALVSPAGSSGSGGSGIAARPGALGASTFHSKTGYSKTHTSNASAAKAKPRAAAKAMATADEDSWETF